MLRKQSPAAICEHTFSRYLPKVLEIVMSNRSKHHLSSIMTFELPITLFTLSIVGDDCKVEKLNT